MDLFEILGLRESVEILVVLFDPLNQNPFVKFYFISGPSVTPEVRSFLGLPISNRLTLTILLTMWVVGTTLKVSVLCSRFVFKSPRGDFRKLRGDKIAHSGT